MLMRSLVCRTPFRRVTEPPSPPHAITGTHYSPPQLWLAQSLTASRCSTCRCWSLSPGWPEQGSRSNATDRVSSCSLNNLGGQALNMPRHIRACTVEKEMEAPLTGVLEKDTGSNLMSKHLHMANLRTLSSLSMCLGWEQSLAPVRPSASTIVIAQAFIQLLSWNKYVFYPQPWMRPLQWKFQ